MSVLYLLRHAKSSWDVGGLPDHERPLAPRGRQAASSAASYLVSARIIPALVLCSSATRAMQTYDPIAEVLTGPAQLSVEDALYGASATSLLARLREIPGCVDPVLLIGHNPGLQDLLVYLAADGKPAALSRARSKFPTAGLAALRFDGAWADLRPGTAYLESFWTPKDHLG